MKGVGSWVQAKDCEDARTGCASSNMKAKGGTRVLQGGENPMRAQARARAGARNYDLSYMLAIHTCIASAAPVLKLY